MLVILWLLRDKKNVHGQKYVKWLRTLMNLVTVYHFEIITLQFTIKYHILLIRLYCHTLWT